LLICFPFRPFGLCKQKGRLAAALGAGEIGGNARPPFPAKSRVQPGSGRKKRESRASPASARNSDRSISPDSRSRGETQEQNEIGSLADGSVLS